MTRLLIWLLVFPRLFRWALGLAASIGVVIVAVAAAPVTTVAVTGYLVFFGPAYTLSTLDYMQPSNDGAHAFSTVLSPGRGPDVAAMSAGCRG